MSNTDVKKSFKNVNLMAFEEDLKRVNWNESLTLSEENSNLSFKTFLKTADRLIDKHWPKESSPPKKLRTKSKSCMTLAFSNSMKIKNRIASNSARQVTQLKKKTS